MPDMYYPAWFSEKYSKTMNGWWKTYSEPCTDLKEDLMRVAAVLSTRPLVVWIIHECGAATRLLAYPDRVVVTTPTGWEEDSGMGGDFHSHGDWCSHRSEA